MKKIALAFASIALILIPASSASAEHKSHDGDSSYSSNRIDWD